MIKALKIEGFKTYKNHTVIEDLDPGHNVIVGRNGSGKSCIFDAIQFVLSDKYGNLRSDERHKLLYVSVVFTHFFLFNLSVSNFIVCTVCESI